MIDSQRDQAYAPFRDRKVCWTIVAEIEDIILEISVVKPRSCLATNSSSAPVRRQFFFSLARRQLKFPLPQQSSPEFWLALKEGAFQPD
jgi:hypothetical protein